jgi:hypothetical protein
LGAEKIKKILSNFRLPVQSPDRSDATEASGLAASSTRRLAALIAAATARAASAGATTTAGPALFRRQLDFDFVGQRQITFHGRGLSIIEELGTNAHASIESLAERREIDQNRFQGGFAGCRGPTGERLDADTHRAALFAAAARSGWAEQPVGVVGGLATCPAALRGVGIVHRGIVEKDRYAEPAVASDNDWLRVTRSPRFNAARSELLNRDGDGSWRPRRSGFVGVAARKRDQDGCAER